MRSYLMFVAWTVLAGAGIPLIGVLNSGIARSVGNPFTPTAIMFAVAMVVAVGLTLALYGYPTAAQLASAPPESYAPVLIIGFYALSATIIIPRFGAASFVAYILIAQLLTSAVVDQFGLFSMERRPLDMTKLIGLTVIVVGIAIMEIDNLRKDAFVARVRSATLYPLSCGRGESARPTSNRPTGSLPWTRDR